MKFNLELSIRNCWIGLYWETWPEPYRQDIWIGGPFLILHIIRGNKSET